MKKILVANRGEIAVRVIRACQELNIKSVAVHSLADKDSLHAKLADESVCIGPGPSAKSYLNIPSLMAAAEVTGADAIHPGYGFLSENFEFAAICAQHHLKFIGPTPDQIRTLGNKIAARDLAQKSGVPLLPGSDGPIEDIEEAFSLADKIGYPVIIKAAAGGGGKGMKVANNRSELKKLYPLAQTEALASFGDGTCFIEKYLRAPRHIEAQIVADEHGDYLFVGERDCSIQRRHQKLVEEAPCFSISPETRQAIGDKALNLVKEFGYQSLGTVEFLYQDGEFYFMEMNTRAQVEHPVTEMVSSLDLIKIQIQIAMGKKLSSLLENRCNAYTHSLECRINAEDPHSFVPWPGKITAYHEPGGPGVRVDSMIYSGYSVPSLYDSMILKLITYGCDRMESISRMQRALRELKIEGIRTNIPFHLKILNNPKFQSGDVSTNFLEELSTKS